MMKHFNLTFFCLSVYTFSLLFSCTNNDHIDSQTEEKTEEQEEATNTEFKGFETAPSSDFITTGTVDVITESTVRYHVFNLTEKPYTVTMVETENHVVIIDLGPGTFAGSELKKYYDAIKKTGHVIITHNHSDHYSGADSFTSLKFYAQTDVATLLNDSSKFGGLYASTVIGVNASQIIGDLTFKFDKVSNTETGENGYIYNEKHKALFAGDLVYNLCHPFLREYTPNSGEDEIDNWITGLNILKDDFSEYNHIFVGHNGYRSDISTVINENIDYLENAQAIIKGIQNIAGNVKATNNQDVVDELIVLYPNYLEAGRDWSLPGAIGTRDPGASWF